MLLHGVVAAVEVRGADAAVVALVFLVEAPSELIVIEVEVS